MIKLPEIPLPEMVVSKLKEWQDLIDKEETFELQRSKAKMLFKSKNTKSNTTFNEVKKHLTLMCNSTRRCVYCEDSLANQVEHIYPKDFFPQKCFEWENYVYACGPCNQPKNNQFAILIKDNGQLQRIQSPFWPENKIPPEGNPAMLNPRVENPLDYAILDIKETFLFFPLPSISVNEKVRAEYTFNEILKMNQPEREMLRIARKNAYENFKDALFSYLQRKNEHATQERLNRIVKRIQTENHQTVWKEMQRWHQLGLLVSFDLELENYFIQEPDALNW
jgi:hypothetical protein